MLTQRHQQGKPCVERELDTEQLADVTAPPPRHAGPHCTLESHTTFNNHLPLVYSGVHFQKVLFCLSSTTLYKQLLFPLYLSSKKAKENIEFISVSKDKDIRKEEREKQRKKGRKKEIKKERFQFILNWFSDIKFSKSVFKASS